MIGNNPAVFDASLNRILRYDAYETWPKEDTIPTTSASLGTTVALSPPAKQVIGQADFLSFKANRGLGDATEASLTNPIAGAMLGSEMFVVETAITASLCSPRRPQAPAQRGY